MKLLIISSIIFISLSSSSLLADSGQTDSKSSHHTPHVVGIFLGGVRTDESTEFSFGAEYEYHFHQNIGVGVIVEHTLESAHFSNGATVALAAIHLHAFHGLRVTTAVGAEVGHGNEVHEAEVIAHGHREPAEQAGSEFMVRLGLAYDFNVTKEITVAPTVSVDFVSGEENVVFGTVFSYHF